MTKKFVVALLAGGLLALLVWMTGSVFVARNDEMHARRAAIEEAWNEVDAAIAARADVVPHLAKTIRKFGGRALGEELAGVRRRLAEASDRAERIAANDALDRALAGLPELAGRRPHLQTDSDFARLQDELADAEIRLGVERRRYNQAVQDYNTYIQLFPNTLVAWVKGFEREPAYFRTSEEARQGPPPVSFSGPAPAAETTPEK